MELLLVLASVCCALRSQFSKEWIVGFDHFNLTWRSESDFYGGRGFRRVKLLECVRLTLIHLLFMAGQRDTALLLIFSV